MAAETAKEFEALEAQARDLLAVFVTAGYEAVAPAMIQPADVFLDCIGEALRARTYVFSDPEGHELCLRPDLTVPTCRLHLARDPEAKSKAKYCYNGAAFRFQPAGAGPDRPREFRQAGIESFGEESREAAEAETLALMLKAVRQAGLEGVDLLMGDIGLVGALLAAVPMPERWRQRLMHELWRPDAFRAELQRLARDPAQTSVRAPRELLARLVGVDEAAASEIVAKHMASLGVEVIGARGLAEITASLTGMAEDVTARPLPQDLADLIARFVAIKAPAGEAVTRLDDLAREGGLDITVALARFDHRLVMLRNSGVGLERASFSADFGSNLEYYTGFVFEMRTALLGANLALAGGGRYDRLMKAVGAPVEVPAVGGAIHTERLLAAVKRQRAGGRP